MSAETIVFDQIVYGKRVQFPGGPIVSLDGYHHTGCSPGVNKEILQLCVPKIVGIAFRDGNWRDYRWRQEQKGWAIHTRECAGKHWMIAVRASALSEAGESGPAAARLYEQAHYLVTPLSEWRAEALAPLLDHLKIEPMTEDCANLPTISIPLDPDPLTLAPNWFDNVALLVKALVSGESVGWQSGTFPDRFLDILRICLAALPDAVSCRMPVGAALGLAGSEFALFHALGVNTPIKAVEKEGALHILGCENRDLRAGERYIEWIGPKVREARTAGDVHQIVQHEWRRFASAETFDISLPWQETAKQLGESIEEKLMVRNLKLLETDPELAARIRIVRGDDNQAVILSSLLDIFRMQHIQDLILITREWPDAWQSAISEYHDRPKAAAVAAILGIRQIAPQDVSTLLGYELFPRFAQCIVERIRAALTPPSDRSPWLSLIGNAGFPGSLPFSEKDRALWLRLVCQANDRPERTAERLGFLGSLGPLPGICARDRWPDAASIKSLVTEITGVSGNPALLAVQIFVRIHQAGSALAAMLFLQEYLERAPHTQFDLADADADLANDVLREIDDRKALGQIVRLGNSTFIIGFILNYGNLDACPKAAKSVLADFLGGSAGAILRPLPPPIRPPDTGFRMLRASIDLMPAARKCFWLEVIETLCLQRVLVNRDLAEVVDLWIDRDRTVGAKPLLSSAAPFIQWHAYHTQRGPRPAPETMPASDHQFRRALAQLITNSDKVKAEPEPGANGGEAELYFWLARAVRANPGFVRIGGASRFFPRVIAELSDEGLGEREIEWIALLDRATLQADRGWRVLWRVLKLKQSGMSYDPIPLRFDSSEADLLHQLPPNALIKLVLARFEIPPTELNDIILFVGEAHDLPAQDAPDKVGSLRVRRESQPVDLRPAKKISLSLSNLFTLAKAARRDKCFKFLAALRNCAIQLDDIAKRNPVKRSPLSSLIAPLRSLVPSLSYESLQESCR